jgi:hypothetical protein
MGLFKKKDNPMVPPGMDATKVKPELPAVVWMGSSVVSSWLHADKDVAGRRVASRKEFRHVTFKGACEHAVVGYPTTVGKYMLVETVVVQKREVCDTTEIK